MPLCVSLSVSVRVSWSFIVRICVCVYVYVQWADPGARRAQLCHITYASGESRDVMKTPKSSAAKTSLPGQLFVGRAGPGTPPMVYPKVFACVCAVFARCLYGWGGGGGMEGLWGGCLCVGNLVGYVGTCRGDTEVMERWDSPAESNMCISFSLSPSIASRARSLCALSALSLSYRAILRARV